MSLIRRDRGSNRGRYSSSRRHNNESSHPRNDFSSHHYRHHRETESSCSRVKSRDQDVDLRDSLVYANHRQRRHNSYCSWSGERGATDGTRLGHDGSTGVKRARYLSRDICPPNILLRFSAQDGKSFSWHRYVWKRTPLFKNLICLLKNLIKLIV